jgi:hypothetical protein
MKRTARILTVVCLAAGMAGIGTAGVQVASANGTVISGCPTTAEFRADLAGPLANGGTLIFTCGVDMTLNTEADGAGSFYISGDLTLVGNGGPGKVIFDGNQTDRIFTMAPGVSVDLSYLTLQHGASSGGGSVIDNVGTVTITNSTLSDNSSSFGGNGGAIFNESGHMLSIANSTLSGNTADGRSGGAIANAGTMSITNSTLSGNSAHSGGNSGAILNLPGGTLSITDSTLSGNSADFTSGGISNSTGGTVTITNSTLSGNSVGANGAGGVYNPGGATLKVGGSIIANSTGGNCANGGAFIDLGYNLSDDSSCAFSAANHDLIDTNPQLGPLQNNGGPTQTMALPFTSPAIDTIPTSDASLCPSSGSDQRGYPRPDAGESVCDIGAYEFQDPTSTQSPGGISGTLAVSSACIIAAGAEHVSPTGVPSGTLSFRDERPGGMPCSPLHPGALSFTQPTIQAVVCTSHTSVSIYGTIHMVTAPGTTGQVVRFQLDEAITSTGTVNGTMSLVTSSGYASGVLPATVHLTGC